MSYWSEKELKLFRELNYLEHEKVTVRKTQHCYNSGDSIYAGEEAEMVKVYPSSLDGRSMRLEKPTSFYKCGTCGQCTH